MSTPRELTVTLGDRMRQVRLLPLPRASRQAAYEVTVDERRLSVEVHQSDAHRQTIMVDGKPHRVHLIERTDGLIDVMVGGELFAVRVETALEARARECARAATPESHDSRITSPMPGKVVSVDVIPGQRVDAGAKLLVLEAMKMQNEIRAKAPGKVRAIHVATGEAVEGGELLMEIEKLEPTAPAAPTPSPSPDVPSDEAS